MSQYSKAASGQGQIETLSEFEEIFNQTLPAGPLAYYRGGAGDEVTLRANTLAWRDWRIHPSVMVDVSSLDTSVSVVGKRTPSPFIAAPTAYHRLACPLGEEATAEGCARAGSIFTLSTLATARPRAVANASPGSTKWFQVYVFKDRGVTQDLISEAVDCGFEALVLTADLPVLGKRDGELRSGFVVGEATSVPGVAAAGGSGEISMQDTADLIDPSLTWADVEQLASSSPIPVIVKGILRPDDARAAINSGAGGVVVSNHGGRQLDCTPATAHVLESIASEVNGEATVIVDGGIRRGTDALVALALGADAVMVGRPILWGLAADGSTGVCRVLEILTDEFERALALSGCPQASLLPGRRDLVIPIGRAEQ